MVLVYDPEKKFIMVVVGCKILLLILWTPYWISAFGQELGDKAALISELKKYFRSGCVFLRVLNGNRVSNTVELLSLQKAIMERGIPVGTSEVNSIGNIKCKRNKPLNILFLDKEKSTGIKLELGDNASRAKWLLFMQNTSLEGMLQDMYVPFNCEFIVAQWENGYGYSLYEIYRVSRESSLQIDNFGFWTIDKGLTCSLKSIYSRRWNLQGIILKTAVLKSVAVTVTKNKDGNITKIGGYLGRIWNTLEERLKFISHYMESIDGAYGSPNKSGSWSGVIGMIQRKEVDAGPADLAISVSRMEVVYFTSPILDLKIYLFVKQENISRISWTKYFLPFKWQLWIAVVITAFILANGFSLIYYMAHKQGLETLECPFLEHNYLDSVSLVLSSLFQQGHSTTPSSMSCRTLYLTSYVVAVIVLAGYSAALVSYLASREVSIPFQNYEEFLEDGTYQLDVLLNSFIHAFFSDGSTLTIRRVYAEMKDRESNFPRSVEEGMNRLCFGKNKAFILQTYMVYRWAKYLKCNVMLAPGTIIPASLALPLVKGSPYIELFIYMINKMRYAGILQILKERTLATLPPQPPKDFYSVELIDMAPLLTALGFFMLLSILLLIAEYTLCYIKKTKLNDRNLSTPKPVI